MTITGQHATVFRDPPLHPNDLVLDRPEQTIAIDFSGADPSYTPATLVEQLTFPDLKSALAELPPYLADLLPGSTPSQAPPVKKPLWTRQADTWSSITDRSSWKNPVLTHQVDPAFSDEARLNKFSGSVRTILVVGNTGRVEQVWVARPAPYELADQAMKAVSQYRFRPGTLNGVPVGCVLQVETNFQLR